MELRRSGFDGDDKGRDIGGPGRKVGLGGV